MDELARQSDLYNFSDSKLCYYSCQEYTREVQSENGAVTKAMS